MAKILISWAVTKGDVINQLNNFMCLSKTFDNQPIPLFIQVQKANLMQIIYQQVSEWDLSAMSNCMTIF